jgi:hypothetical protein
MDYEENKPSIRENINSGKFPKVPYPQGYAFYDAENDLYYNDWGQKLRNAEEYANDHESHFDW